MADEIRRQTIGLQQQMVRDYPEVPDIRRALAVAYQNLGASLAKRITQQDWTEAEKERLLGEADSAFQKAVGLLEELHSLYSEVPDYADVLAGTFNLWSSALTGMGRAEAAVECLEKARNFWKQRLETNPDDMNVRSDYGGVLNNLAYRYRALEKLDEAKAMAEEAIVHQEQARAASPENTRYLMYHATHFLTLGRVCRTREEMAVAIPAYRKAVKLYEELHDKLGNDETRRGVGGITSECGLVQFRMKDATVADREEALKLMRRGFELFPESSVAQYNLGASLTKMERWDEALAVLNDMPENEAATRDRRTWSAVHMALALAHQGKIDAANDRLAQARKLAEDLEERDNLVTDIAEVEQLLKQSSSSSEPSKDADEER
jgi:tetratricopeptide (TPR) repeat protein